MVQLRLCKVLPFHLSIKLIKTCLFNRTREGAYLAPGTQSGPRKVTVGMKTWFVGFSLMVARARDGFFHLTFVSNVCGENFFLVYDI